MTTSPPERRTTLRLTIFDDPAGLTLLLSDGRNLALQERVVFDAAGLTPWQGSAWLAAAAQGGLMQFGHALALALLPASVARVLARQVGGWLHLQISERLLAVPWELAALATTANPVESAPAHTASADTLWHLDERFTVVRQIMAAGAPAATLRHREPGALLQVLHLMPPGRKAANNAAGPPAAGSNMRHRNPHGNPSGSPTGSLSANPNHRPRADINNPAPQPGRFGPLVVRVQALDPDAAGALRRSAAGADIVHLHFDALPAGLTLDHLAASPAAEIAEIAEIATSAATATAAATAAATATATAAAAPQAGESPPPLPLLDDPTPLWPSLPQAPRLLVLEGPQPPDLAATRTLAASRAGLSVLVVSQPAPVALALLYEALASGASFGVAAQRARAAARAGHSAGVDAWFYGDGQMVPLHPLASLAPAAHGAAGGRSASPPSDDLRQITILSIDLVGSTGLMQRLGDEEYSERLTHYHRRVADIAQQHGGLADDPQGDDGFMCYFGYPVASEDSAAQALRAGLALSRRFEDLGLQVRVGIATGRVVIRQAQPVGTAVHHAARLQQQAGAGGVLVSAATRQIAGERFEFAVLTALLELKGIENGGAVYRLIKEQPVQGTERFDGRAHLTPFIGREAEMARLHQYWAAAVAGARQVVVLRGEAGIGKSRLVREFRRELADAGLRTIECRCAPEHTGSAFQPMIDLLRNRLRVHEHDPAATQLVGLRQLDATRGPHGDEVLALLGGLLAIPSAVLPALPAGMTPERQRQRTMDWMVRISQALDARAPVCLLIEDVHWIDPSTRELLQRLIDGPPRQRLLLLLTLRSGSSGNATDSGYSLPTITLGGLGPEASRALLQGAVGQTLLDPDLAGWLAQRADGVPLFIEESARMAAALSAQQPSGDIAVALRQAVPATLQDLLMARLDQFPLGKRAAQLGSALGRSFTLAQIEAVNAHEASPIRLALLGDALATLVQSGLLTQEAEGGQRHYSFKHALVGDAAYQSLLERDRRRLHGAIAAVLVTQFASLCASRPEWLAHHHEHAGMTTEALAGWEQAARHAAQRSAHVEAIAHLRQALALLAQRPDDSAKHRNELRLQLLLASRLIATAGYGAEAVELAYTRALLLCQLGGQDAQSLTKARLGLEGYHFMRGDFARATAYAEAVAASLGPVPDPLALIQSNWARANLLFHQGEVLPAVALMDQCLHAYWQLGHRPAAVQDPGVMCLCYSSWALWELGQADQALQRARRVVDLAEGLNHPFSMGEAYGFLAVAHYFRGETEAGLAAAQRAVEICENAGFAVWLAHAQVVRGRLLAERGHQTGNTVELSLGLQAMQTGHAQWAATGAVVTRPFYLALWAEGLALAGQPAQALALIDEALALIDRHGERYYEPELLRLKGTLLLACGQPAAQAEPWLQRALASAHALHLGGLALKSACSLAELWAAQGRTAQAAALLAPALAALGEGRSTRDQTRARALLAAWSAPPHH